MLTSNDYVLDEKSNRLGSLTPTPDSERTDREKLWSRMREQGYLFLPRQLDPEDVLRFRSFYFQSMLNSGTLRAGSDPMDGIGSEDDYDRAAFRDSLYNVVVPSREYAELCATPRLRDWFEWFLGEAPVLHKRRIIRQVGRGEKGIGAATQAHYDLVYLREGTDRVLSAWIPIGDCPVERGGLIYLEGTHRDILEEEATGQLRRPAASITADLPSLAAKYDRRWLVADYRAGDVVIHSAHIIHASLDNVDPGNRVRLSTDIRYQRASEPIDWRWTEPLYYGDDQKWDAGNLRA